MGKDAESRLRFNWPVYCGECHGFFGLYQSSLSLPPAPAT